MIHGHGDDLYKTCREVKANFSTNVWYEADTNPLCSFLTEKLSRIFHYPEPDAGSFRQAVAKYHGLKPENILAGNGATELFYNVAHAFAGGITLLPVPSFKEYEDACSLYDHHIRFISESDFTNLPEEAGLMFICNPNNPDGKIWSLQQIRNILEEYPDMVLVVDESFIHFAPETESALPLLSGYHNLLIIRSMTKCYAIPGLRLGYMMGEARLIEFIGCFSRPWSVNALAVEAGKFLLASGEEGLPDARNLLLRQFEFSRRLSAIPGFYPQSSHTSFFLVKTDYQVAGLKTWLLEHHGILIRDASNFRGLDSHYFRINTLTDEKNNLLLAALREYV